MKKMKILTLLAALLPLFAIVPAVAIAQADKAAIKEIDAYCKTVDAVRNKRKSPELVFADVADYNDTGKDKPKWRRFASEKALDKFREKTETYSIAYNWRKGGKIVASNFTLFSGSGDWAKYVYHYFRNDGSLARVESELRTFYGDYIVIRRNYFDRDGKLIRKSVKYLDLTTRKPKKPEDGGVMGDDPKEVDYYKKTSKLPFARLMK